MQLTTPRLTLPRILGAGLLAVCLSAPPSATAGGFFSVNIGGPAYGYGGYRGVGINYGGYRPAYGGYYGPGHYGSGYSYGPGYGYRHYRAPVVYTQPRYTYVAPQPVYAAPVYRTPVRTVSYGPSYHSGYYGGGYSGGFGRPAYGTRGYIKDIDYDRNGTEVEYRVFGPGGRDYEVEVEYDRFGRIRDFDIDD